MAAHREVCYSQYVLLVFGAGAVKLVADLLLGENEPVLGLAVQYLV